MDSDILQVPHRWGSLTDFRSSAVSATYSLSTALRSPMIDMHRFCNWNMRIPHGPGHTPSHLLYARQWNIRYTHVFLSDPGPLLYMVSFANENPMSALVMNKAQLKALKPSYKMHKSPTRAGRSGYCIRNKLRQTHYETSMV